MNANVHANFGLAAASGTALLVTSMRCGDPLEYAVCAGCAVIGALLPDIDANGESKAKKEFRKVMGYLSVFVAAVCAVSLYNGTLLETAKGFVTSVQGIGAVAFIACCIGGYLSGHRKFTHWLVGLALFSASFFVMTLNPRYTMWFGTGFLSHQVVDMLNKRKITWLYPLGFDFARYVCYADSTPSKVIGAVSIVCAAAFLVMLVMGGIGGA